MIDIYTISLSSSKYIKNFNTIDNYHEHQKTKKKTLKVVESWNVSVIIMPWRIWLRFLGEGISCLEFKLGESEGKWVWH
jgi:hypothetical protein